MELGKAGTHGASCDIGQVAGLTGLVSTLYWGSSNGLVC